MLTIHATIDIISLFYFKFNSIYIVVILHVLAAHIVVTMDKAAVWTDCRYSACADTLDPKVWTVYLKGIEYSSYRNNAYIFIYHTIIQHHDFHNYASVYTKTIT